MLKANVQALGYSDPAQTLICFTSPEYSHFAFYGDVRVRNGRIHTFTASLQQVNSTALDDFSAVIATSKVSPLFSIGGERPSVRHATSLAVVIDNLPMAFGINYSPSGRISGFSGLNETAFVEVATNARCILPQGSDDLTAVGETTWIIKCRDAGQLSVVDSSKLTSSVLSSASYKSRIAYSAKAKLFSAIRTDDVCEVYDAHTFLLKFSIPLGEAALFGGELLFSQNGEKLWCYHDQACSGFSTTDGMKRAVMKLPKEGADYMVFNETGNTVYISRQARLSSASYEQVVEPWK
ncbi:MAG: hypothetical protein ACR2IE_00740 [Candidatus Sumerlaeaceae bacterium]